MMSRAWAAVFAAAFAAFAWACPPSLAAYRDAGEMAAGTWSLGVLHPTSYPLYSLFGRAAAAVPLGDPAHRLALFSALCAALAVAGAFELARRRFGLAAGAAAGLLLFLNPTFWSTAVVQEMYALWMLSAVAVLACALWVRERPTAKRACAFAFLLGLSLGNRLDLLLWTPGLLWLAFSGERPKSAPAWAGLALVAAPAAMLALKSNLPMAALVAATAFWVGAARPRVVLFGALGFSVYLYLPIRSASGPWLDWNHPAVLSNFLDSLLRTRYGGTLDLLSTNYARGELFLDNMALFGRHLWDAFSLPGLAAAAAGVYAAARRAPQRALGLGAAWLFSGPIFLLLANMPPNPHAMAVVEPHYLLSDLALAFFAAEGFSLVPPASVLLLLVLPGVPWRESRRRHYEAPDFARDALISAPPGTTLVARKDVPLYSLWYAQTARGKRPDVKIVSQGLSGARWYGGASLKSEAGWRALVGPRATPDVEGAPAFAARALDAAPFHARRQDYGYEDAPDFFSADLVAARAQALHRLGGSEAILEAWSLHWLFPEAPAHLAFLAYQRKDWPEAARLYALACGLSEKLVALSEKYRSLPAAKLGVRRQYAELLTHRGVVAERLGERAAAETFYQAALATADLAQTRFNYAVLYWNRDWALVERELEAAARLGHPEAARYLGLLRRRASGLPDLAPKP